MDRFTKRLGCAALMAVLLISLYGCQQTPTTQSVVNKNDGSFDSSVIESASEIPAVDSTQTIAYTDKFASTDKSVMFTYNLNGQYTGVNNPVVEVVPHYLTETDVKRVATALLGDVDWFEPEPRFEPEYTKEQILEKINRWAPYANVEAISKLCAREPEYTASLVDNVKRFIEKYSALYEAAPSGSPKACEWTFKKESYGFYSAETLAGQDLSQENDAIYAVTNVGEVEYTFSAVTRNMGDFKLNNIYLHLGEGRSPSSIDSMIYRAKFCRTEKPTDEDVAVVTAKAERILDDMDLGQWQIDTAYIHTTYYGDTPEYIIIVSAVPVFNGTSAVRVPQIGNLKSMSVYASNYYMTDANFQFSVNGDLLDFSMFSPINIKEILNENVATKCIDELLELAKNHLMLSDYHEYGMSTDYLNLMQEDAGEEFVCQVDICQMDYGMLRVKVPSTDESYYYVPGIILSGTIDYIGKHTGNVYAASGETIWNDRIVPLIALNAVDGSVIEIYIN